MRVDKAVKSDFINQLLINHISIEMLSTVLDAERILI